MDVIVYTAAAGLVNAWHGIESRGSAFSAVRL